jgi:tRNA (guanosine-2'-O-)-methyltransferase
MDELEEAMRLAGGHLAEVEALVAAEYERDQWRGGRRDSADEELVRRALDIPFLRDLLRTANRIENLDAIEDAGFIGRDWNEGEGGLEQPSCERFSTESIERAELDSETTPPARIVAAERALADRTRSLVVVLDHLINARNVSAILRSIECLGLQELHIIDPSGKPELERTLTTRAERFVDLHWHRDPAKAFDGFRERGYRVLAAHFAEGSTPIDEVPLEGPTAIVFGSEQTGVSEEALACADGMFHLPNSGFTAYINVSVATALSVYALDRRMRVEGLRESLTAEDKRALRPGWFSMLARGKAEKQAEYLAWAHRLNEGVED